MMSVGNLIFLAKNLIFIPYFIFLNKDSMKKLPNFAIFKFQKYVTIYHELKKKQIELFPFQSILKFTLPKAHKVIISFKAFEEGEKKFLKGVNFFKSIAQQNQHHQSYNPQNIHFYIFITSNYYYKQTVP